jgi:tetratricopeptide (TPR) repeat protein
MTRPKIRPAGKAAFLIVVWILMISLAGCSRSPEQQAAVFLKSGKGYFQKQDYASALLQFKNAARALPANAEPFYYMGLVYISTNSPRQAVQSLVKATQLNPKYVEPQIKLAELMVMSHQQDLLQQARERLEGVVAYHPDNSEALVALASERSQSGDLKEAEKYLKDALDKHPDHLAASTALALLKLSQKDWSTAEEILKQATIRSPRSPDQYVALGELYLFNGRGPEADEQFRRALQINPNHAPALLHVASQHAQAGRLAEAEKIYRQLSQQDSKRFGDILPAFLLQQGKLEAAITEYQQAVHNNPDNRSMRDGLITAYFKTGRWKQAGTILDETLRANPKDGSALLEKAQLLLHLGKPGDSRQVLETLLGYQPTSAEAHFLLAEVYRAQNTPLSQRQELSEALRLNPWLLRARLALSAALIRDKGAHDALDLLEHAPAEQKKLPVYVAQYNWTLLASKDLAGFGNGVATGLTTGLHEFLVQDGVFKFIKKDFAGAQESLERALQQDPKDLRALEALADCYVQQKHPEIALQKIHFYAARQPRWAEVQLFEGNWLAKYGRLDEARVAFLTAEAASPEYAPAQLALGKLDLVQGKNDGARSHLTRALALNEHDSEAHRWLATIEASAGNYKGAILHYHKVLDVLPSDANALNDLACILSDHAGQLEEAFTYAQRAKELAPNDPATDDTLGWILSRKGLYGQAMVHLRSASGKSESAVPKYHLAITYFKVGDVARGKRALAAALKVDPSAAEAVLAKQAMAAVAVN